MTIYITAVGDSGVNYAATIERLADGYYREDDAEVFGSGLAFADKDISLTEGTGAELGSYTTTVDADTWDDGLYRLRIHHPANQNMTQGSTLFGVVDGEEVDPGEINSIIYHADIQYIRDDINARDEYMARWFKNGVRLTSGITTPSITVVSTSGTALFQHQPMNSIAGGALTYFAVGAERQTAGEIYEIIASGVIDNSNRVFSWILSRDAE